VTGVRKKKLSLENPIGSRPRDVVKLVSKVPATAFIFLFQINSMKENIINIKQNVDKI